MRLLLILVVYGTVFSFALSRRGFRSKFVGPRPASPASRAPAAVSAPGVRATHLLIVGATGGTGRELVAQALERGHEVTAFARDPTALGIENPRLRVVRGDVLDYASLEAAVRGQDAVLSALGHRRYFPPTRVLSEGTRNLLRALESHGTRRFVCETSLGIGDSAGRMGLLYTLFVIPAVLPFYYWDKVRQERLIAECRVPWVIVRPGALQNGAKRGVRRHGPGVGSWLWTPAIPRADVAAFMLDQITDDAYLGSAPGVA
jgi:uncharacterized protein YbjT (DUF2867 family)